MKKQLLFLSVAVAALLSGCSKNQSDTPEVDNTPATEISAKASTAGSIDTKAPVTGTSLDGKTADVYCSSEDLRTPTDASKMFTDIYGRGTMTFDDTQYVSFDAGSLGGKNGGSSLLPQDGSELFMYGFYPSGWTTIKNVAGGYEELQHAFDGKTDLMATYLKAGDEVKIAYKHATTADRGELTFKHMLTRYNIQVKGMSADAITAWGKVKSIKMKKEDTPDLVSYTFSGGKVEVAYSYDAGKPSPICYKLGGTTSAPTYTDDQFEAADFATSQALTDAAVNACYTMIEPVEVDADKTTAELTLEVVTLDKVGGKEKIAEVPISLDQSKFTANANSTRGYSITITLNFRAGAIQAIATVEEWKDGGNQDGFVDEPMPTAPKIGDVKDGGIVYWVDSTNPKFYKVFSLNQGAGLNWSAKVNDYVVAGDSKGEIDGRRNMAAIKAYFDANPGKVGTDFSVAYPAAAFCDAKNTGDVTGWYLPAKDELQAFYDVYAANKTLLDGVITTNHGTAMAADYLWSATESPSGSGGGMAWRVSFSDGDSNYHNKDMAFFTRCIRNTAPIALEIGDLKDGGIIYEVNGADYKVFSLKTEQKAWAKDSNLQTNVGATSTTDGRVNVAALKARSADTGNGGSNDFAVDFPAAAYCEGLGAGWYLPAQGELQAIYNLYYLDPGAWESKIINNGGTGFSRALHWSSTADGYIVDINFAGGSPDGGATNSEWVRCVKRSN